MPARHPSRLRPRDGPIAPRGGNPAAPARRMRTCGPPAHRRSVPMPCSLRAGRTDPPAARWAPRRVCRARIAPPAPIAPQGSRASPNAPASAPLRRRWAVRRPRRDRRGRSGTRLRHCRPSPPEPAAGTPRPGARPRSAAAPGAAPPPATGGRSGDRTSPPFRSILPDQGSLAVYGTHRRQILMAHACPRWRPG